MTTQSTEYTCKECGHGFGVSCHAKEEELCCPRCGCTELEHNPYLLGGPDADGLSPEDYFDVAMAPCCVAGWKGWRNHYYSNPGDWQPTKEKKDEEDKADKSQ